MPRRTKPLPDPKRVRPDAEQVLGDSINIRAQHRRRNRADREPELAAAIARINAVQRRLRRLVQSSVYKYVEGEDYLRHLSDQLQRERRKLRKMLETTRERER